MRITADKALARWMDHSQRGGEVWNQVRQCVLDVPTEDFVKMGDVIAGLYTTGELAKGICVADTGLLERVRVPCLFVAGSRDSMAPEEMEEYAGLLPDSVAEESRCWVLENTGRLPWWGDGKGEFVMGLKTWIGHHALRK